MPTRDSEDMEGGQVAFSVKELLGYLRTELHDGLRGMEDRLTSIDLKLDLKADRGRVHELQTELATLRFESTARASLVEEFRTLQKYVYEELPRLLKERDTQIVDLLEPMNQRITRIEDLKNRILGGSAVVVFGTPLLTALLVMLLQR